MQRRAIAYENGECVGEITCEEYGHTLDSKRVWWVADTKKKYLFYDAEEYVGGGEATRAPQPVAGEKVSHFELYTGPVIHGGGFSF